MSALSSRLGRLSPVTVGVVAVFTFLAVTVVVYQGWFHDLLRGSGRVVQAEFTNAQQLRTGDQVRLDGLQEGRVTKIESRDGGRSALVEMEIDDDAGPLYRDAKAQLRWKNLLGGAFYIEIDRGSANSGPLAGRPIAKANTITQVELDDVLSIFGDRALRGTKTMADELARGLRDGEGLARAAEKLGQVSPNAAAALRAVQGVPAHADLRNLVRRTASTVRALDAPGDDLRTLVSGAAATLQTTAARDDDLRDTLAEGGATSEAVRSTLARLESTLGAADGLVAKLDRAAGQVAPTLRALRPTVRSADTLLTRARPVVRALRPAVRSLASAGRAGSPLLDDLRPSLQRLDKSILPYLAEPDPETGKSTTVMIGGTAAGFGGAAGQQDTNGHFVRFPASLGDSSVYLPCRTALTDPSRAELLACESLQTALERYLSYVPALAPRPGGKP